MSDRFRLRIPKSIYDEMIAQIRCELPNEGCGALAGVIADGVGQVTRHYPMPNAAASPKRYEFDGKAHCAANRDTRERGIDFLAFYHSHPTSPPVPSETDLKMSFWGTDAIYMIISLLGPEPEARAWWLSETEYRPAEWEMTAEP